MRISVRSYENLWNDNPHLEMLPMAKKAYKRLGEEKFNKHYYAVYQVADPLSPARKTYVNVSLTELKRSVKKDLFDDEEEFAQFSWAAVQPLISEYQEKTLSREKKLTERLFNKLTEAQQLVDGYKMESIDDISKLNKNTKALEEMWEAYFRIKKQAEEDEKGEMSAGHGGQHRNILMQETGM